MSKIPTNSDLQNVLTKVMSSPEHHFDNLSVYIESQDEYYPVKNILITKEDDVLDKGHMVLVIE